MTLGRAALCSQGAPDGGLTGGESFVPEGVWLVARGPPQAQRLAHSRRVPAWSPRSVIFKALPRILRLRQACKPSIPGVRAGGGSEFTEPSLSEAEPPAGPPHA